MTVGGSRPSSPYGFGGSGSFFVLSYPVPPGLPAASLQRYCCVDGFSDGEPTAFQAEMSQPAVAR